MSLVIWPKFLTFIAESVLERARVGRRRVQMVRKIEGRRPQLNRLPLLNRGGRGEGGVGRSRPRSPKPRSNSTPRMFAAPEASKTAFRVLPAEATRPAAEGERPGPTKQSQPKHHQAGLRTTARKGLILRPGSGRSCRGEGIRTLFTHQKERSGLSQSSGEGCRLPNRNRLLPHPRSYRRPRNPASQRRAVRIRAQCRGPRPLRLRRQ